MEKFKVRRKRQWNWLVSLSLVIFWLLLVAESSANTSTRGTRGTNNNGESISSPVRLRIQDRHVEMDNGIVIVTLSRQHGRVTGIHYNGIPNLLEHNKESNRGYWDVVWNSHKSKNVYDQLEATKFRVIKEDENQVELSFTKIWDGTINGHNSPLNVDKRFVMLRGRPGFYSYAIFEHLKGWPDVNIEQTRIAFKLQHKLFNYMAISDERQRVMPTNKDRERGRILDYKEAVLLTNPSNPKLKGEVDDKYQYSNNIKDNRVHGWISNKTSTGFWVITPSDEFRAGGPVKQELTSHAGPISLAMFFSGHYHGEMSLKLRNGEHWKKVFGPVFIYLNSASHNEDPDTLWTDAKHQMLKETKSWPYDFPMSEDYPHADQRGSISGELLVRDRYINRELMPASNAHVGLALPGHAGSWDRENRGYQFWTQTDDKGYFYINGVRPGNYNLYGWVPGILGDYKHGFNIIVTPGHEIKMEVVVFDPPRKGPTLWEIGIPDRSAAEFYVPDPIPALVNKLYINHPDKFRQYGLWNRYSELFPSKDLVYTVGVSNYTKDWFYAQVTRNIGNKIYESTTWQIAFDLQFVNYRGTYTLQLALASASTAELQVRVNNPYKVIPDFTTGLIGKDNAIARHGIHGLYRLYNIQVSSFLLHRGMNVIYLRQARNSGPFTGVMYDYIRLEGPYQSF